MSRETMTDFEKRFSDLVHAEVREALAEADPDRMASRLSSVMERLASCLGTSAAIAAAGDPRAIDKLLIRGEQIAAEMASRNAPEARSVRLGFAALGPDRQ